MCTGSAPASGKAGGRRGEPEAARSHLGAGGRGQHGARRVGAADGSRHDLIETSALHPWKLLQDGCGSALRTSRASVCVERILRKALSISGEILKSVRRHADTTAACAMPNFCRNPRRWIARGRAPSFPGAACMPSLSDWPRRPVGDFVDVICSGVLLELFLHVHGNQSREGSQYWNHTTPRTARTARTQRAPNSAQGLDHAPPVHAFIALISRLMREQTTPFSAV